MSARDELAKLVQGQLLTKVSDFQADDVAKAILVAGYTKPRTITTAEELAALAFGSIVLDANGDAELKVNTDQSWLELRVHGVLEDSVNLPATVLYEPAA